MRSLRDLPLETSYRNLGRLRLEQGDLRTASVLLDRAVERSAQPNGPIPAWDAYHYRGRVRIAQGRLRDGLADLRVAIRLARAWRWSAPPDDGMRVGAEGWIDLVHSALIEAGNRLYIETGDAALIRETFEAAEENRANSLRALVEERGNAAAPLPASYWEALLGLQRAEVADLRHSTPVSEEAVRGARAQVAQIEAASGAGSAGGTLPLSEDLLRRARGALDRDSAIIGFHLGDQSSWMWAMDADGIALYRLAAGDALQPLIENASRAIRQDDDNAVSAGAALYQALFGSLAPRFLGKSRWLLALDGQLFDVPFAALPVPSEDGSPRQRFMIERRVVQVIPSVAYWLARGNPPARREAALFLGVGDPIYNSADPRLPRKAGDARRQPSPLDVSAALAPPLPRLVASAAELKACARAWQGDRVLLEGAAASPNAIEDQFGRHPDVLHFATHFVSSADPDAQAGIALSLTPTGAAGVLEPSEIARWHIDAQLVVLSGCHSAAGAVLPGTGLLGLNRAWLAAGARNVIGSHWAVPDENGSLFAALYRNLSARGLSATGALRAAQLEMLHSGGWRAHPQYWGAYFAMGKD